MVIMQSYEKLLDKAFKKLPEKVGSEGRFKIPRAEILPAGAKTIITNFTELANTFRRKPEHLLKFLLKELATSGDLYGSKLTVQGRFRSDVLGKKIELYAKEYVLCPDCGRPDTKLVKEDRFLFLKCEACGARHAVKRI
jgi:translation initiation factor 2 subunit 2